MRKYIKVLRDKFKKYEIDGYVIPKNDDYFTEYSKINRLKIISNFSGSAGLAVILKNKNEDDFEFNQDFEENDNIRSPGWIRYQKRIK